jgi:hypothetical protein
MKKIIALVLVCSAMVASAVAQDKAIGFRFNGGYDNGAEISFQKDQSATNRLEVDLGFGTYGGFALTGLYDWKWELNDVTEGLAWYAGPGVGLRLNSDGIGMGIVGQIGIEYNLEAAPIQFSLDARPGVFFGSAHYNDYGAAFGVRYRF